MLKMATANYNELTHSNVSTDWNSLDPLYHWDTHFPEKFSKLTLNPDYGAPAAKKKNRRGRSRCSARYKTQPITFDEIKEVDEEGPEENKSEGLKTQLLAFSRSMDGLIPKYSTKSASLSPLATNQNVSAEDVRTPAPDGASAPAIPATSASGPAGADSVPAASGTSDDTNTGPIMNPDGLKKDNFRQRRRSRKKLNRSIEEIPEPEKIEEVANITG